jgi:hypothetical protein
MALTHIGVMAMRALLPLAMQSAGCHGMCSNLSAVHMHTRLCLGVTYGRAWGLAVACVSARLPSDWQGSAL